MKKIYPARFVGEFGELEYAKWKDAVPNIGDVALVLRKRHADDPKLYQHLLIRCGCGDIDRIPIEPNPHGPDWQLTSRNPVHFEPSLRVSIPGITLCHYYVHGGQLQMLDDTTAELK